MVSDEVYSLAKRRGYFWPSFDIYGGAAGFYNYGPLGALLKRNITEIWRRYYVVREECAEISTPNVAIEDVFRASGHLDEFSDLLLPCTKCAVVYRADTYLQETLAAEIDRLEKRDNVPEQEIAELRGALASVNDISGDADAIRGSVERFGLRCSKCGGAFGRPEPFNLMFRTQIGPGTGRTGYLRPETAQAMFTNFGLIYKYFREKLPFGIVQVGSGFRNEISPRQGLFRMREFNMLEAEVFFDPEDKRWPRYEIVKTETLPLFYDDSVHHQTLDDAVSSGVVANGPLAYFMHLTKEFLLEIGIDEERLRFRQHGSGEMAHYASDCWDAEIETSLGWIEAVGIADRGDFDLGRHIRFSGADLRAMRRYSEPREMEVTVRRPIMKSIGPRIKRGGYGPEAMRLVQAALSEAGAEEGESTIEVKVKDKDGNPASIALTAGEDYTIAREMQKVAGEKFVPHVIEPSYGLDRILYSVVEHAYARADEYTTLRLRPCVAPINVGVFPLMQRDGLDAIAREVYDRCREDGLVASYDEGGSIGRRYARMDEVGTPLCVTVDYQSLEDRTVTVRDRDSKEQRRVPLDRAVDFIKNVLAGNEKVTAE